MKTILMVVLVVFTGCTGPSAREEYYAAVAKAAAAQAQEAQARYTALTSMAGRGCAAQECDGAASVAAVMAIALSSYTPIQPAYIESTALKWASILVGPITTLGALSIQSDLSRDLSRSNRDLGIARIEADAATDIALFGFLSTPAPTPNPIVFPDIVFPDPLAPGISTAELDIVVDGLVDLGLAGMDGIEDVSETGFQTIEDIVIADNMTLENLTEMLSPIIVPVINQPFVIQPVVQIVPVSP